MKPLSPYRCDDAKRRNSGQWWHASNRDHNKRCCSGLKAWNTDQCLVSGSVGSQLATSVCDLQGTPSQTVALDDRLGVTVNKKCLVVRGSVPVFDKCKPQDLSLIHI